ERDVAHPHRVGGPDQTAGGVDAFHVSGHPWQPSAGGPAAVAVHDDCDVRRHGLRPHQRQQFLLAEPVGNWGRRCASQNERISWPSLWWRIVRRGYWPIVP